MNQGQAKESRGGCQIDIAMGHDGFLLRKFFFLKKHLSFFLRLILEENFFRLF